MIKMKKPKRQSKHIEFKEPSLSELLKHKVEKFVIVTKELKSYPTGSKNIKNKTCR